MKQPETLFKERVQKDLKTLRNTWFVKIQQVSIAGTPDILMCVSGRFIALELKTDTGVTSRLQEYTLEKINKAHGIAMVSTPSSWEHDLQFLQRISSAMSITRQDKDL